MTRPSLSSDCGAEGAGCRASFRWDVPLAFVILRYSEGSRGIDGTCTPRSFGVPQDDNALRFPAETPHFCHVRASSLVTPFARSLSKARKRSYSNPPGTKKVLSGFSGIFDDFENRRARS